MAKIGEGLSRISKTRATTAALAAATLVAGCSIPNKREVNPAPEPVATTAVAPTPTPTEAAPYDPEAYQSDPQRVARITTAMKRFGLVVLNEAKTPGSGWGPLDIYCEDSSDKGGLVSRGYKPAAVE